MPKIKRFRFRVKVGEARQRLDVWLAKKITGFSRSMIATAIKSEQVWLDGKTIQPSTLVKAGQTVTAAVSRLGDTVAPEHRAINIIHQDKHLVVINKPAGVVMHPAGLHKSGTLANALKAKFKDFYLVHRLDKDTSGIVLVVLDRPTKDYLSKLFKDRKIEKTYIALVVGKLTPTEAYLDFPIQRDKSGKFASIAGGRTARSYYKVTEYLPGYTLTEVHPETGRTHQIRVHFKTIRHPVAGDNIYGTTTPGLQRQFLHASKIKFKDWDGKQRVYTAKLPHDLTNFLKNLSLTR